MLSPEAFPFLEPSNVPDTLGCLGTCRIERLIGEGASCFVFAGTDVKLLRTVAVRALKPLLIHDSKARSRFLAESRAGAAIQHPNVLPVYEVCESKEALYAVIAFNDGETLEERLERETTLSLGQSV